MSDTQISTRDLKKAKLSSKQVDQLLRDIVTKRYFLTKTDIEKYVKDNAGYLTTGITPSLPRH